MCKLWKALVMLSVTLNFVGFIATGLLSNALLDAQWENLKLFHQLSSDQQALRRKLNAAAARFGSE